MAPADTRKRDPVTTEHVKDAFVSLPEKVFRRWFATKMNAVREFLSDFVVWWEFPKVKKESEAILSPYRAPLRLPDVYPSVSQVTAVIPPHCFVKSYFWSFYYAIFSGTLTFLTAFLAWRFLPEPSLSPISLLAWAVYAYTNGAIATGMWVVAHECGHGAFCDNKIVQDCIGFVYHSFLLVPYYSWQRSHAIHHSRTNHITEGESHVPFIHSENTKTSYVREFLGDDAFAISRVIQHLVFGWPAYLLFGITGGSVRGVTNHFIPYSDLLYPGMWKLKVLLSDVGVGLVIYGLYLWGQYAGSATVLALYVAPYLVVNCWLVAYTWLQHTDVDVPHYDERKWTWIKGAFATIDRPYPEPFDTLHHRIGSTHVAHHLYHRIPHYHAREATNAIRKAFPEYYIYDPTPLTTALFRIAAQCPAVEPLGDGRYFFTIRPTEQ